MRLQSALRLIYPPQCIRCGDMTEAEFALCADCWRDTGFIDGMVCDRCGTPLPGDDAEEIAQCDDCLAGAALGRRPWRRGRAAALYRDTARKLVLALKHGDRTDLARPLGGWLARAAAPLIGPDTLLVPVPLHRGRLWRRRYNQAALLSGWLARLTGCDHCPDALQRIVPTRPLEGHDKAARFEALDGAIVPHPRRGGAMVGRPVLIVDDVMTSGATFAAAARAAQRAGAEDLCVVALARVAKDT